MPLRNLVRGRLPRKLGPELEAELGSPIHWMYPWQLTRRVSIGPPAELASIHTTRLEMIEPVARAALAAGGPDATVLDLGCNEGWFAHRALDWGATRVVGIDVRASNLRRATLVRDHFGIPEERLRFECSNVHELDVERLGGFDLVLMLGLIYHLEDPFGALRVARALTRGTIVIESQLTAHNEPLKVGWGTTDQFRDVAGHWAAVYEPPDEQAEKGNPLASYGGVVSLVPNRAALLEAIGVVGFREPRMLAAPRGGNRQYVEGHRGIVAAS
jgi:SAM-dependent methyltransferase